MSDTARTTAALQTLFADNHTGAITPQMLRDFLVSTLNTVDSPVSTFIKTLLDDTTAAAARTTLGVNPSAVDLAMGAHSITNADSVQANSICDTSGNVIFTTSETDGAPIGYDVSSNALALGNLTITNGSTWDGEGCTFYVGPVNAGGLSDSPTLTVTAFNDTQTNDILQVKNQSGVNQFKVDSHGGGTFVGNVSCLGVSATTNGVTTPTVNVNATSSTASNNTIYRKTSTGKLTYKDTSDYVLNPPLLATGTNLTTATTETGSGALVYGTSPTVSGLSTTGNTSLSSAGVTIDTGTGITLIQTSYLNVSSQVNILFGALSVSSITGLVTMSNGLTVTGYNIAPAIGTFYYAMAGGL